MVSLNALGTPIRLKLDKVVSGKMDVNSEVTLQSVKIASISVSEYPAMVSRRVIQLETIAGYSDTEIEAILTDCRVTSELTSILPETTLSNFNLIGVPKAFNETILSDQTNDNLL